MAINKYFTDESLELFVDKIKEYTDNAVSQVDGSCVHDELTNEQIDAILGPLDGGAGDDSGLGSGSGSSGSADIITDATLTQQGMAADAKATGDAINNIKSNMVKSINGTKPDSNGNVSISSINGEDGEDGISPTISTSNITNGYRLTITDVGGTRYVDINNGIDGKDGINGKDGTNGINGTNGEDGVDGEDGVTYVPFVDFEGNLSWSNDKGFINPVTVNIKGPAGKDGTNGVNGENGKSAYEIAISNGYIGTESEWLLSLNGVDGINGTTPIKGEDYFTEEDKAELVVAVLSSLTAAEGASF